MATPGSLSGQRRKQERRDARRAARDARNDRRSERQQRGRVSDLAVFQEAAGLASDEIPGGSVDSGALGGDAASGVEDVAMGSDLDSILEAMQQPGIGSRRRAYLRRLAKFAFRRERAQAKEDFRSRRMELRVPELIAKTERQSGRIKRLEEDLGVGDDFAGTFIEDDSAVFPGGFGGSNFGAFLDPLSVDEEGASSDGATSPGLPGWALPLGIAAVVGLAVYFFFKAKR